MPAQDPLALWCCPNQGTWGATMARFPHAYKRVHGVVLRQTRNYAAAGAAEAARAPLGGGQLRRLDDLRLRHRRHHQLRDRGRPAG